MFLWAENRSAGLVALVGVWLLMAGPAMSAGGVVISQMFANNSASNGPDYVELFNQGNAAVDFAAQPHSIQFGANELTTAGAAWESREITSGTIDPGRYFLVQLTEETGGVFPTPDYAVSSALDLAPTGGRLALATGTEALVLADSGGCPDAASAGAVVDLVGYGANAACYEGMGPALSPGDTANALFRKLGGCQDTDDNSADFEVLPKFPRNAGTTPITCDVGIADWASY